MLKLQTITIERFRGIRSGTLDNFASVNLLIGRNNSGKTTVLEAICRAAASGTGSGDFLGRSVQQVWSSIRGQDDGSGLWYKQETSEPILLKAGLVKTASDSRPKVSTLTQRYLWQNNSVAGGADAAVAEGGPTHNDLIKFFKSLALYRPEDGINRTIERHFWPKLLATRRDKLLTGTLNDVFKLQTEGLQLLPDGQLMTLFPDYSVSVDLQGDGTRSTLRALMVLTMMTGSLLLLEEPECHHHPGSLGRYAQALCKQSQEQQVQLIISTHSSECVRSFLEAAGSVGSDSAVFHLTLENGVQTARRLDAEAVETLQATGVDVRFLDLYG